MTSKFQPIQGSKTVEAAADAVYEIDFPHELPTYVLARFAGVNVDPYTLFVATIMLRDFNLPINGQKNISYAVTNIPVFSATDERLQFGWGDEAMMRSPYMHQKGYEHACIMISLCSTFHEPYAVEVLHAMTVMTAGPNDLVPHMKQWRELIRSTNGAFIPGDFDLIVEEYVRLDPYCVGPGSNLLSRRCLVQPKAMAKALVALSKVTSGKEKRLILLGGAVLAWFGAIGEFFYDLRVTAKSCGGGHLRGPEGIDDAQLVLFFHQDPDLEILETPFTSETIEKMEDDDLAYTSHVHYLPFGGRVQWQSLLPRVFGRAYHHLDHEEANTLNTAIGAAARGLEILATASTENSKPIHGGSSDQQNQRKASPTSYGSGLVNNITAWLPELRRGQGRMERQLKKTGEEAAVTYLETMARLQRICHCVVCSTDDTKDQPKDGYCLPVIVETVLALGLSISRMIVVSRLFPSREGVQGLYNNQVTKRLEAKQLDPRSPEFFQIIYGNEWNASDARRLQNAVQLFSGIRPVKHVPDSTVAVAHEGICAYMASLTKSDQTPITPDDMGLIKVTSGAIYARSKLFERVSEEPISCDDEEEKLSWEEIEFDHRSTPLYFR